MLVSDFGFGIGGSWLLSLLAIVMFGFGLVALVIGLEWVAYGLLARLGVYRG